MVSEQNIDEQHNSKTYRIIIGALVFVFLVLVWYALTKVAVKMQHARDNMRVWLQPVLLGVAILFVLCILFLIALNIRSRHNDRKKHQS